jgi:hypothetical protein
MMAMAYGFERNEGVTFRYGEPSYGNSGIVSRLNVHLCSRYGFHAVIGIRGV